MRYLLLFCLPLAAQMQTPLVVYQSSGSATGEIRFQERRTNGTNHVGFRSPDSVATDRVWTLPAADGTNGQALTTDGSGVLSWVTPGGLPVIDTTAVVKGSSDATKLLRFEVDGFTTATTRVLTPQNASYTLAGTDIAQTFSAAQTFNSTLNAVSGLTVNGTLVISASRDLANITSVAQNWVPYLSSYELGSSFTRWGKLWAAAVDVSGGLSANGNVGFGGNMSFSGTATPLFDSLGSIGSSSYKYGSVYAWSHYAYTGYYMGGTQVMDSSRNLTNIGTITTSGAVNTSGGVVSTSAGIGGTGHNTYYGGSWYYGVAAQTLNVTASGGGSCTITVYGGVITGSTC